MPTIYIPNPNRPVRCVNQIEDVCKECECHVLLSLFRIRILMDPDPDLDPLASQFGDTNCVHLLTVLRIRIRDPVPF
jgi:hypothetical protein